MLTRPRGVDGGLGAAGDVHRAEPPRTDRPYFEVLVVEDLSEAQERVLREELRRWRRPDDPFVYEIVVVPSVDDAIMAARLNFRLQACLVRRRFTHRSRHESSFLAQFVVSSGPDDLMDRSPDDRAQELARSLAKIRPELDLYLSILDGVGVRYRAPFFSALRSYSHRPTGVFHALPISHGKSIVNSHWIKDMLDFYGLFSPQILAFMRSLDTPEVHGNRPDLGYRVYLDKALEITASGRRCPRRSTLPPDPARGRRART